MGARNERQISMSESNYHPSKHFKSRTRWTATDRNCTIASNLFCGHTMFAVCRLDPVDRLRSHDILFKYGTMIEC